MVCTSPPPFWCLPASGSRPCPGSRLLLLQNLAALPVCPFPCFAPPPLLCLTPPFAVELGEGIVESLPASFSVHAVSFYSLASTVVAAESGLS